MANKYVQLLLVITAALSAFAAFKTTHGISNSQVPATVDSIFTKWTVEHNKTYSSPKERVFRLAIFFSNLLKIEASNAKNTHTEKLNRFADLSPAEFRSKYLGFKSTGRVRQETAFVAPIKANPKSVDWVTATPAIVNAVKDQGQCGSCWAFSATTALESRWAQDKGTLNNLAEQQLVDCSGSYGNQGCNGGLMGQAFQYIKAKGQEGTASYAYRARDGKCKYNAANVLAHITAYNDVAKNNGLALETASAAHVVAVAVDAQQWSFYHSGIFKNCGTSLDHGVAVVGYGNDAASGSDYWLIRNSWAASWGESGYIRILKLNVNNAGSGTCGVRMMASIPTVL